MVAIFAESLTLGDFLMRLDLSLLQGNAAKVQHLQGFQRPFAAFPDGAIETGFAAVQAESLTDSLSRTASSPSQFDFNRPLKRSLSEPVVTSFGAAVKINPEAKTLAEVTN